MRWGRDVFRGRETIITDIELLLADRNNSTSLALIGPCRCGKSSLIKWFQQLENFTEATRILICIDEFERIETLFPDHGRQLQQFMGLLRATIQDCRRLRLLVAGTASFDD